MIEIKGVTKQFKNETAIDYRDITFEDGKSYMLLGASGCGKSTLLNMIAGILSPERGEIVIDGRVMSSLPQREKDKFRIEKIGYIFQDFKLMKDRTVYENVAIAKRIVGAKERDIRPQVAMALRVVGMEDAFYRPVSELSGGEQQKVCVARAIVGNPYCILADEPTGNLDPRQAREIMLLLERINGLGITTLIATHDREAIEGMEYQRLYLADGRLHSGE